MRGGKKEGFSIPAQCDASARKATSLDAVIVEEFVDTGESGTSAAKRPELQRMLSYVRQYKVDRCIVHKLDRLARSRADDVFIHFALTQAGVTLISTSKNIDMTRERTIRVDYNEPFDNLLSRLVPARVHRELEAKKTALPAAAGGGTGSKTGAPTRCRVLIGVLWWSSPDSSRTRPRNRSNVQLRHIVRRNHSSQSPSTVREGCRDAP